MNLSKPVSVLGDSRYHMIKKINPARNSPNAASLTINQDTISVRRFGEREFPVS